MADAPDPVTSAPSQPGQPYDATSMAPVAGWAKLPGGPCGPDGRLTGQDFPSDGPWRQC